MMSDSQSILLHCEFSEMIIIKRYECMQCAYNVLGCFIMHFKISVITNRSRLDAL